MSVDLQHYRIIAQKVLDGTASDAEKAELEVFLETHHNDPAVRQELLPLEELEEMPEQLLPPEITARVLTGILEQKPPGRIGRIAYWGRIAAAAAIIIFICSLAYRWVKPVKTPAGQPLQYLSVVTQPGQHKSITLPDGSRILLNGSSNVRFPQDFDNSPREVYLEGEAFFTVSRDSIRPFIVHTAAISTTVLGTSFNVRCFGSEDLSQVAVATGKVKVALNGVTGAGKKEVYVTPGQQATCYGHNGDSLQKNNIDIATIGGWKERAFFYEQTPLRGILADLEGVYGLRFKVMDAGVLKCTYTVTFKDLPVDGILKTLSVLGKVQFKKQDSIIIVSGKPCP